MDRQHLQHWRASRRRRRTGAQDKALAVLGGGHEPRIYRHIGVDLDAADAQAEGFEELWPDGLEPRREPQKAGGGSTDQTRGRGDDALPNPCAAG